MGSTTFGHTDTWQDRHWLFNSTLDVVFLNQQGAIESQHSLGACHTTLALFEFRNQWVPTGAAFRDWH